MGWDEIVQKSKKMGVSHALVLREEMQKACLVSLSKMGAFNHIVFQGGTALRIFYNNPRFSDDLDFVLVEGEKFHLSSKGAELERHLSTELYYLQGVRVRVQKDTNSIQRMSVKTLSDIPLQRLVVNIELFHVPSYYNSPRILQHPPLNPVVRVEEKDEILADKIIAIALRQYLKGRDIWDIHYLTSELDASTAPELVEKKARDYGVGTPWESIKEARERLLRYGARALDREMKRFLPPSTYRQLENAFVDIVKDVALQVDRLQRRGKG